MVVTSERTVEPQFMLVPKQWTNILTQHDRIKCVGVSRNTGNDVL